MWMRNKLLQQRQRPQNLTSKNWIFLLVCKLQKKKKIYFWENFSIFCGENVSEERIGYAVMSQ